MVDFPKYIEFKFYGTFPKNPVSFVKYPIMDLHQHPYSLEPYFNCVGDE